MSESSSTPTPNHQREAVALDQLTRLMCRNNHDTSPILHPVDAQDKDDQGTTRYGMIGAYCRACRIWIKWVPKSSVWEALLKAQRNAGIRAPYDAAIDGPTIPADVATASTSTSADVSDLPVVDQSRMAMWTMALTEVALFTYDQAGGMGFHATSRTLGERCMLVITELAELFEAYRKGTIDTPSNHIPAFTYREEEWADVLIRVWDHALDEVPAGRLAEAVIAKLLYNRTRGYRHGNKAV